MYTATRKFDANPNRHHCSRATQQSPPRQTHWHDCRSSKRSWQSSVNSIAVKNLMTKNRSCGQSLVHGGRESVNIVAVKPCRQAGEAAKDQETAECVRRSAHRTPASAKKLDENKETNRMKLNECRIIFAPDDDGRQDEPGPTRQGPA